MNIRELAKPLNAKALNETLARKFGKKIALEKFTLEQLQDVRNKLRTTLSQVETNESFDAVQNETYQKNKLFLDVLNAEINEREDVLEAKCKECNKNPCCCDEEVDEGKMPMGPGPDGKKGTKDDKPAFLDQKTGDKKSKGKKPKKGKVPPQFVKEGAEDQAEIVMAAKDMVNRVTSWMEDTAEMQTESMLELADAIRDEQGQEKSDAFVGTVKPALETLYTAMESTRESLTNGVGQLTGEVQPAVDMGDEPLEDEPEMEPTVDAEADVSVDAAEAGTGGEEEAGRAKRESTQNKRKMLETSRRLGTILSKKK